MKRLPAPVVSLVVGVIGLSGCSLLPNDHTLPGQTAVGSDGYGVTVTFNQVGNLVPNSAVEMNNVVVGTVAGIDVSDWQAHVRLRLLKSVDIPVNAVFSIGQKTLLGAQYVEVSSPTGAKTGSTAPLLDGQQVPPARTGTYPATEQVLGAVALLLNNGGLSQIQTISSQVSQALTTRVPDTRELVRQTNDLLGVLDANKGQVVQALTAIDRLSTGLASDRNALASAIDQLGPGLRTLDQDRNQLVQAVSATGGTTARLSQVITATHASLVGNVNALREILDAVAPVASSVPDALKIGLTIPFPAMTTTNALRGDYANLFATLDLRGSSLANSWLAGLLSSAAGAPSAAQSSNRTQPTPPSSLPLLNLAPLLGIGPAAAPSSSPSPTPSHGSSHSSCLLAILGMC